jgi:hypothetical protein
VGKKANDGDRVRQSKNFLSLVNPHKQYSDLTQSIERVARVILK